MAKLNLKKTWKHLYQPVGMDPALVEVPEFSFLMVDGAGDPNRTVAYVEAVEALFAASYAIKFRVKKAPQGIDYAVMPLEGLWWADDMAAFSLERRDEWRWTMMILQPECASAEVVHTALAEIAQKKKLPGLSRLRLESFTEGRCAQVMHTGPFTEEGPTIARLHRFIEGISAPAGKHHEIYLSDVRRCVPAAWRTILRQPLLG